MHAPSPYVYSVFTIDHRPNAIDYFVFAVDRRLTTVDCINYRPSTERYRLFCIFAVLLIINY